MKFSAKNPRLIKAANRCFAMPRYGNNGSEITSLVVQVPLLRSALRTTKDV
jgi:hypothetical protein